MSHKKSPAQSTGPRPTNYVRRRGASCTYSHPSLRPRSANPMQEWWRSFRQTLMDAVTFVTLAALFAMLALTAVLLS